MVRIVTVEGLDYSGKTTTIADLARKKKNLCFNEGVVYPTGLTARLLSMANQATELEREFLYTAIMIADKNEADIRNPGDERIFIQDRYWPSVVSYGRFLNEEDSMHNSKDYSQLFIQPDTTILLSCSNEEILRRSEKRGRKSVIDRVLLSQPKKVEALRQEIEKSIEGLPHILRIDTTSKHVETVGNEIMAHLETLGLKY